MTRAGDHSPPDHAGSATAFARWLRASGLSYRRLAERLAPPVSKSLVGFWIARVMCPGEAHRTQIDEMSEGAVPFDRWLPTQSEIAAAEQVMLIVERAVGGASRYAVLDRGGRTLFTSDDVVVAKRHLDMRADAVKLVRCADGAPLSIKTKLDPATERYLAKQLARAG